MMSLHHTRISCFLATLVVFQLSKPTAAFLSPQTALQQRSKLDQQQEYILTLDMGKSRKARRMAEKKQERTRSKQFFDAIDDAQGKAKRAPTTTKDPPTTAEEADARVARAEYAAAERERQEQMEEAERRFAARPEVSSMIIDEETGTEVLAQGKNVMDVVSRKPVRLSNVGPQYRLAQMFPGIPMEIRSQYRFRPGAPVEDMVAGLMDACTVTLEDGNRGIPPHPSVANKAIDFVLANRDLLGHKMKRTLGRITAHQYAQGNNAEAQEMAQLWKNFLTLENHISAPFRQMLLDAEGIVGPNFGNLEGLPGLCAGYLYQRCAAYIVLKGMVAHWEKKVVDADTLENNLPRGELSRIAVGDPRRLLPDPPILFTLKECTQVCYMAQQMTKTFVETPELFDDLPPELRFLEAALTIRGGTPLRRFMNEEFCPAEEITPAALREGMRRLLQQLDNMQPDPYADLCNVLERLIGAMSIGSDDEADPYVTHLVNKDPNGPGRFDTYTFNQAPLSSVRFMDAQYPKSQGRRGAGSVPSSGGGLGGGFGALFNLGKPQEKAENLINSAAATAAVVEKYEVPPIRSEGRPHELGWLELLEDKDADEEIKKSRRMGQLKPGSIIAEN